MPINEASSGGSWFDATIAGVVWRLCVFATSAQLVVDGSGDADAVDIEARIIGGGATGGTSPTTGTGASGGGAGGRLALTLRLQPGTYPITVGAAAPMNYGGMNASGQRGGDTSAFGYVALGGGLGSAWNGNGGDGGSGGGAGSGTRVVGKGTTGQGFDGGNNYGGGGGAGGAGQTGSGVGGLGVVENFDGTLRTFSKGGDARAGASPDPAPLTDYGTGGPGHSSATGAQGRPGVVMIRYRKAIPATTGTVSGSLGGAEGQATGRVTTRGAAAVDAGGIEGQGTGAAVVRGALVGDVGGLEGAAAGAAPIRATVDVDAGGLDGAATGWAIIRGIIDGALGGAEGGGTGALGTRPPLRRGRVATAAQSRTSSNGPDGRRISAGNDGTRHTRA